MLIGGKEYKTGQRIKVINAKSILHYKYGIGCPNESDYCTEECRIYKKYQKRLARMEEDKEQERYLQEYAKRKQEKKNRKEGKR